MHVYQEFYEVPDPRIVQQPPLFLHKILQETTSYSSTGDVLYTVPRGGSLLALVQYVRANANRTDSIDGFRTVFNKTDTPYNEERQLKRIVNRLQYGNEWPVGCYIHDFYHATQEPFEGDSRDIIDTEALASLEQITAITSGTTLGSGTNFVDSIRRIVQVVQM